MDKHTSQSSVVTAVGVDLGKRFVQVHGVDETGKAVMARKLSRAQVEGYFGALPPGSYGDTSLN